LCQACHKKTVALVIGIELMAFLQVPLGMIIAKRVDLAQIFILKNRAGRINQLPIWADMVLGRAQNLGLQLQECIKFGAV